MTNSDLPERLRNLGGQPFTGEKVKVLVGEKWFESLKPMLLERANEQDKSA